MKVNYDFGKLVSGAIQYAPTSVKVVIHHHDEYDAPVYDEDGNPVLNPDGTQKTEHIIRDWDEVKSVLHPTAEDYLNAVDCAYKRIIAQQPTEPAPEGYHYEEDGWSETETTINRVWKTVQDTKVIRTFSKLKIYGAITSLNKWNEVQTWLEAKNIDGINGWMAFQLAQDISEEHPLFVPLANEAKQLLNLDDSQFEALLNNCILD